VKCEINLNWNFGDEDISMSRQRDETFAGENHFFGPELIALLDDMFVDFRAVLLARMTTSEQKEVPAVTFLSPEQAAELTGEKQ
jgi:hypothetical protein